MLLDVNMPGMDGFETAALIRQRKTSEHTPIIFITAFGDDTHASRGYSLGAVDYILAPVEPEVLKTKVGVFVELFRKTAQVRIQAQILEQRAAQLERLTRASIAINSALSPDQMLQAVTEHARDILGAHQAVAIAAVDQKWSAAKSAVALSPKFERPGERAVLRDRPALLSFLSRVQKTVRFRRGDNDALSRWPELIGGDRPVRLGWLAAPLSTRDGHNMGLLHVLDKRDGDFTAEDEAILTQLAQMSSIAIENTLNAEAREANRIKDEFLTTLSHELRTPLSAILGWTRILRTARLDSERSAHGLAVIERNVLAQTKLIDDLLDVSRIITGKLRLTVRSGSLVPIIEAAMEAMRPAAEAKDIQIAFERGLPAGDDLVVGDPDRLQQVVWNLFSNAIKFTPARGRVEVELSRDGSHFQIRVSDNGKGVRPEFLPHVFDRFRQADSTSTRVHGGLGIGLAIARHLVELHGGTITAESAGEGMGSTFTLSLPAVALGVESAERARRPTAEIPAATHEELADLTGARVLVVEDEPDGQELLVETLRAAGAEVRAAGSAQDGFELVRTFRPDVLVSDVGMPGEDGYALVERVRRLPLDEGGMTPALAVTAYAREEDRIRAAGAGFQNHIAKPFEPSELVSVVGRLAGVRGRREEDLHESLEPGAEADARRLQEGCGARVLVIEDDNDSREGLRSLLEIWGYPVEVADTGERGIEMAIERRPEIALIDIGLPELDGYQVASRIREVLGHDGIFLVALTGYADGDERRRALASGFNAHVSKPIDFSILDSLLASPQSAGKIR